MAIPIHPKKFGVIGYGNFGQLWAQTLACFGSVSVLDYMFLYENVSEAPSEISFVSMSEMMHNDILFLAVPFKNFEKLCLELSPQLNPQTIVVDVCGVKVYPSRIMAALFPKHQPYAGTHPLFGPKSVARTGLAGSKLVFCPLNLTNKKKFELLDLFVNLGLKVIETTPEYHDRKMASSQVLIHLIGRALNAFNLENQEISTPDYESLLRISQVVNSNTWQLFLDMQIGNPYAASVRSTLLESLTDLDKKIKQEDPCDILNAHVK